MPNPTHGLAAGDLLLVLEECPGGISLSALRDREDCRARDLTVSPAPPLFRLTLRRVGAPEEKTLVADAAWRAVHLETHADGFSLEWRTPEDPLLAGLRVLATARPVPESHAWHWSLQVHNDTDGWSVWRVVFPQLSLGRPGDDSVALVPFGPGQLRRDAWDQPFRREAHYPGGWWWGLQFVAAYASQPCATGLYVGLHDPLGSTKDIVMQHARPGALGIAFDHPAPDMGRPGIGFTLPGEAVWQLLRGDWFDAAQIYKAWASQHAPWWPRLGPEGREDTPLWMRELPLWVMGWSRPSWPADMTASWRDALLDGAPPSASQSAQSQQVLAATVASVRRLRDDMGLPLGFHWYGWHLIPFDNDYPHYFPALPGFADAVCALQEADVHVMPYINGRLWDTRDRGAEDWEFTRLARPSATKDEHGQPNVESYGSKEADGSPVRLAPMCPTTPFWQEYVRGLVRRLFEECGVHAVYVDQVAAAEAELCFDPAHGHPLGGGHWWNQGYWHMLDALRRETPPGRVVTTECNAESFVRWFDGYLTWHWQQDDMVPAWPAVYGGAVQMFGRAYGGTPDAQEPTQALAWRMRAAQQLVFGEQLGWFSVDLANAHMPLAFIRQLARLRWALRRYFYAGEMLRPPRLLGAIPSLCANWQWHESMDNPWVHTPALLTGAWRLRADDSLVAVVVNASDAPITARLRLDPRAGTSTVRATLLDDAQDLESRTLPATLDWEITWPAGKALAVRVEG